MATIDIKRSAATILSPLIDDRSKRYKVLNGEDYVILSFNHNSFVEVLVGDHIVWDGVTYKLKQAPTFKKVSVRNYTYELRFEGPHAELKDAVFLLDSEGEFYLTGKAEDFIDLMVTNLNRVHGADTYYTGSVTATDFLNLQFNNETCLEVLQRLCEEFELEYYFSAGININLTTAIGNSTGLTFQYNDGLHNIKRNKVSDKNIITRAYVYGSEKNIDYNYGANRLHLPVGSYPDRYIQSGEGTYGIREAVKHFDEIYPHFEGTVTSSAANNKVIDTSIDFDLNDHIIEGLPRKIVFLTGDLAGMEFEILDFNNYTHETTFKTYTDENGQDFPDDTYNPSIGDEFTFVDITMPTAYITQAEADLAVKAVQYLADMSSPNIIYDVEVDWHQLQQASTSIDIGDLITITDSELAAGGVEFRVLEFSQSIANEYKYTIKLGELLLVGFVKRTRKEREIIRRDVGFVRRRSRTDVRATRAVATKKSATYVQASEPTSPDEELAEGDLWFSTADPGSGGGRIYAYDSVSEDWDQIIGDVTQTVIDGGQVDIEINKQIDYTTCPDNATTNIIIGDTDDVGFGIRFVAERNMGTVQKQHGTIELLYDAVSGEPYCSYNSIGPRLDFTIDADVSGSDIRLNIIVGDDNTNDLSFDYTIISKFLV